MRVRCPDCGDSYRPPEKMAKRSAGWYWACLCPKKKSAASGGTGAEPKLFGKAILEEAK